MREKLSGVEFSLYRGVNGLRRRYISDQALGYAMGNVLGRFYVV